MSKALRHQRILDLVANSSVANQEDLRARLMAEGFNVTQSTLSRDLRELDLVKTREGYQAAPAVPESDLAERALRQAIHQFMRACTPARNLVVLRTRAGEASPLAAAVDHAGLPDLLGTVAGDDTVLLIVADDAGAARLADHLLALAAPRE